MSLVHVAVFTAEASLLSNLLATGLIHDSSHRREMLLVGACFCLEYGDEITEPHVSFLLRAVLGIERSLIALSG